MRTFTCAAIMLIAVSGPALAQAGSTGGTLGNTDKLISGDQEEPRREREEPRKKASPKEASHTVSAPSIVSVAGRWNWTADCQSGHWSGAFTLSDPSSGQFTGTLDGTNMADIGTISGGEVSGGQISFTRTAVIVQHWRGRLAPGHISGSISGNENCTWQASK
jgi:hypothetical protein